MWAWSGVRLVTTHSAIVSNVSTDSDHTITTMHKAKPRIDPSLLIIRWGTNTLPPPLGKPRARIAPPLNPQLMAIWIGSFQNEYNIKTRLL